MAAMQQPTPEATVAVLVSQLAALRTEFDRHAVSTSLRLDAIDAKVDGRPSWAVLTIISTLTTSLGIVTTLLVGLH